MSDLDLTRRRIDAMLSEILVLKQALWAKGIDPSQHEDREASAVVKRIIERAYGGSP